MPKGIARNPDTDRRRLSSANNGKKGGRPLTYTEPMTRFTIPVPASLAQRMKEAGMDKLRQILETALCESSE